MGDIGGRFELREVPVIKLNPELEEEKFLLLSSRVGRVCHEEYWKGSGKLNSTAQAMKKEDEILQHAKELIFRLLEDDSGMGRDFKNSMGRKT